MKFGNNLHHLSIPEWRSYNIDYNDLKAQIRAITQGKPDGLVPLRQSFVDNFDYINLFVQTKHGELARKLQYFQALFRQVASVAAACGPVDSASSSPSARQELRVVLYDLDEIFYGAIEISVVLKNLSKFILIQKIAVKKILKKFLKYYTADPEGAPAFVYALKEYLFQNPVSFVNFDLSGLTRVLTDFMKEIKDEQKSAIAKLNGAAAAHDSAPAPKPSALHHHQRPVSSDAKFDMTVILKKNFNLHFLLPSDSNNLIELVLNLNITLNFKGNNEGPSDLSFLYLTNQNDLHGDSSYIISQKNLSYSTIIAYTGGLRKYAYCVLPNSVVEHLVAHLIDKDDPISSNKLAAYFDQSTSPLTKLTLDAILSRDLKPSMKLVCKRLRYILKKNHEEEEHHEIEQQEMIKKDSLENNTLFADDDPPRLDQISLAPSSDTKRYQDDYYITLDHDIFTTDDPQLISNLQFYEPSSPAFSKFDHFPHNHLAFYSNDSNLSNLEHSLTTTIDSKNSILNTTYPATKLRKLPAKVQNIISTNNSLNMFKSLNFYQYMISCYFNEFPKGDLSNNHYSKVLNLNLLKSFENVETFNKQLNVDSRLKRNLSMKSLASAGAMSSNGNGNGDLKKPPPLIYRNSTISVVSNYSIPSIFTHREEEDDDDTRMLQFYDQSPLKSDKDNDDDYYSLYVKLNEEYDQDSSIFNKFVLKSHKLKRKLVQNIGRIFDNPEKEPMLPQYYTSSQDGKTKYPGYNGAESHHLASDNPYNNYDSINEDPPSFLDRNRIVNIHKEYEYEYDQTLAYIYFCLNLICIFLSGIELGIVYSIFMDMDIPSNDPQFSIANNLWLILVLVMGLLFSLIFSMISINLLFQRYSVAPLSHSFCVWGGFTIVAGCCIWSTCIFLSSF